MKNITKRKVGDTYVIQVDKTPTNIGIIRNSQAKFKGSSDWDVIDLSKVVIDGSPAMVYFSNSSLGGAFEMVKSFIENTTVTDGNVKLSK